MECLIAAKWDGVSRSELCCRSLAISQCGLPAQSPSTGRKSSLVLVLPQVGLPTFSLSSAKVLSLTESQPTLQLSSTHPAKSTVLALSSSEMSRMVCDTVGDTSLFFMN